MSSKHPHLPQLDRLVRGRDNQTYVVTGYQSMRSFVGFVWNLGETAQVRGVLTPAEARELGKALLDAAQFADPQPN